MSWIDKLAILGVRSFSPDEPCYIQFSSPCTVIYGPNGTGKTASALIYLKYACTGDLPPNSKQGAFVHDVKVAGASEVRAQIRLQFYNCNNVKLICNRSLSLTQARSKVSQKTLDTSLKQFDPESGEMTSISTRCSDMDAEIPQHLGVPKAILENVVFCHQEESNWPLSEPAALKKKLDDIFSSTRYSKALVVMRDNRKELTQEGRVDSVALASLKNDNEKARKIARALSDLRTRVNAKRQEATRVDKDLDETTHQINTLLEKYREAEAIENQIKQLSHEEKVSRESMDEIGRDLTERSESDEELRQLLEGISELARADEETKEDIDYEMQRLDRQLTNARDEISSKLTTMGRLEAEAEANQKLEKERGFLLQDAREELGIQSSLTPDDDPVRSIQAIRDLVRAREASLQKIKNDARTSQSKLSAEIQALKSEQAGLEESKKLAKRQVVILCLDAYVHCSNPKSLQQQGRASIRELNDQLASVRITQADLDLANEKLSREVTAQLTEKEKRLRDMDDQIAAVNEEMSRLSRQGDSRTKLSLKRADLDNKLTVVRSIFNEHKAELQSRLGSEPSLDSLEQDLSTLLSQKTSQLQKLQEIQRRLNRELSAIDAKLSIAKESLSEKEQQASGEFHLATKAKILIIHSREAFENQINQECGDKNLPDEIEAVDTALTQYREKRSMDHHYCALCKRTYAEEKEFKAFIYLLEDAVKNIPKKEESLRRSIEANETRRKKLKGLETTWNQLQNLSDKEIAVLKQSVKDYTAERDGVVSQVDKESIKIMDLEEEKQRIELLCKRAEEISRHQKDARELKQEVSRLESELERTGSTRTVTDCQRELEDLSEQGKSIRRDIKRLHDDRQVAMREVQVADSAVRDAREAVQDIKHKMENRTRIERQVDQVQGELKDYTKQLQVIVLLSIFSINEANHDVYRMLKIGLVLSKQRLNAPRLLCFIHKATGLPNKMRRNCWRLIVGLDRYTQSMGSQDLDRLTEEKRQLELKVEDLQRKRSNTDKKMRDIEKQILDRKGTERELNDHLRHRTLKKQLAECHKKLNDLKGQRTQFERASYERQMETLKAKQEELIDQRGGLHGEIRQMEVQVERYQSDLNVDYEDVEKRYHEQFVQLKMNELALADLEKYSKALEQAIMRYHTIKMEDLNKLIREMWVNTYRGGDIEYIQIRADNEGSTASNRSYNYRVVMIKNGKEINMRGRCSAGQKVLTSIIVRLALAEAFCVNCGILTLDEPTTNLDKDNIQSLASNLSRLVESRRVSQRHFQLIIITHDTAFVEQLRRSNIAEYFNHVYKDSK
ncbi:hypothetical protein BJV82DRAFT_518796 [Fennellomyces sp. T-0311]|nr:hypothetical protein BJV82DRAFT_518796 [Fennellomyces sp. T-0311]